MHRQHTLRHHLVLLSPPFFFFLLPLFSCFSRRCLSLSPLLFFFLLAGGDRDEEDVGAAQRATAPRRANAMPSIAERRVRARGHKATRTYLDNGDHFELH